MSQTEANHRARPVRIRELASSAWACTSMTAESASSARSTSESFMRGIGRPRRAGVFGFERAKIIFPFWLRRRRGCHAAPRRQRSRFTVSGSLSVCRCLGCVIRQGSRILVRSSEPIVTSVRTSAINSPAGTGDPGAALWRRRARKPPPRARPYCSSSMIHVLYLYAPNCRL